VAELTWRDEEYSSLVAVQNQELGHAKDRLDEQVEQISGCQVEIVELCQEKEKAAGLTQVAAHDAAQHEKVLEHQLEGTKADLASLNKLLVEAHDEGNKRELVIREAANREGKLKEMLQDARK